MKDFTAYNPTTGEVQHTGCCAEEDFELQAHGGLAVIEGVFEPERFYWDGTTMQEKPARPAGPCDWNAAARHWDMNSGRADAAARTQRARLLRDTDWTQLPDVPAATAALWRPYRQALRDLTGQPGYPLAIDWPKEPA